MPLFVPQTPEIRNVGDGEVHMCNDFAGRPGFLLIEPNHAVEAEGDNQDVRSAG
jgi:hypothetical protein